jgi:uncharacterized protein YndB with AHSA1/START domain
MFQQKITLTRFIPKDAEELFRYFTHKELIEEWSYPDGMSLKVPKFEAKQNGRYEYEHSNKDGKWVCTGYLKEFVPEKRLVFIDTVKNPSGKIMFQDLQCVVEFQEVLGGTDITINQSGFPDKKSAEECRESWNQCIDKLVKLTVSDANQTDNLQREITDY